MGRDQIKKAKRGTMVVCKNCSKDFDAGGRRENIQFCSRKCYLEYRRNNLIPWKEKPGFILKCIACGKDFYVPKCQSQAKFCSKECMLSTPSKVDRVCEWCDKNFS